ncbi:MAG TPA: septal ring lytic transglycosylase RlpA family protein [Chitinophagaceae bacterium]|nr:septal ring lytic transglycosylase RlpA family protein [Chitinophagaceae bacterium]
MKILFFILIMVNLEPVFGQESNEDSEAKPVVYYGTASYYSYKFHGKKTASGEIFSQDKLTAASNVFPLGTWIKVTNLRNGRSVIVKVNDRMHGKMKRVVDLSYSAAQKLNFIRSGLAKVKVEVLRNKNSGN